MEMKTESGCQDSYQEFENYFKVTPDSKLYKKFLRKWKEHFPPVEQDNDNESEIDENEDREDELEKKLKACLKEPKIAKKVFDYKSKKYVES